MRLPDVNICLAAHRSDHVHHAAAHAWLTTTYAHDPHVGISPQVLSSVVRIATQPAFMGGKPTPLDRALTSCQALVDHPKTVLVGASLSWWNTFSQLCRASDAKGKLVADAWLAAMAIEHNSTWVSIDGDFARSPGLKWEKP